MSAIRNAVRWTSVFSALLLLTACGEHGHEHAKDGGEIHATQTGHGTGGEKLTNFSDLTELFVEFPRLVVGATSGFAAHLTRLSDFKPVLAAKVTVTLSGSGQPEEIFTTEAATQPGIFRPEALPRYAGKRELTIEVATAEFTARHLLGPVTVYPDRKAAEAAPAAPEMDGDIGFTKELQWKVDFSVVEAALRPFRSAVSVTGSLRARPDGEALITAQVAGQVQSTGRFPQLGLAVQKGAVLAYLLPRLGGDTDVATLGAADRKAKIDLDQAVRERMRMESLFRDEAVAEKRLLAARATEESAHASYEATQRRVGQYSGAGGGVPIRAAITGSVADVRVSPGAYAQEGQLLFHIADRRVLWLELRVPESEAARITTPSGAAFRVDGIESMFEIIPGKNGRLIAAGAVVDPVTRTLPVIFEFSNPDAALRIGMAVKGQVFAGAARKVVAVPSAAVVDESGVAAVFVQTGGEAFQRRLVRLGARDGDWVEIVDGLSPGQRVVSRGSYLVKLASTRTGAPGHGHAH